MTVVVDATPLIALARIGRLALLQQLFEEVTTTPEVFAEVAVTTRPGGEAVRSATWIHRRSVPATAITRYCHRGLSKADASLVALATTLPDALLITDDRRLSERATEEGVTTVRSGAVLIQAKEAHHITSVKEVLDAMLGAGFRISRVAYRNILRNAGERV